MKLSADHEDIETHATLLLTDLRDLFEGSGHDELFTHEIIGALLAMEERPWSEYGERGNPLTRHQLAALLRPFKIRPRNVRRGSTQAKGYKREQFDNAFDRYLA